MTLQFDVIYAKNTYQPLIAEGDFVISEATEQNTGHLLIAHQGELRHNFLAGVGLSKYLEGHFDENALRNAIVQQLDLDGKKIMAFKLTQIIEFLKLTIKTEK